MKKKKMTNRQIYRAGIDAIISLSDGDHLDYFGPCLRIFTGVIALVLALILLGSIVLKLVGFPVDYRWVIGGAVLVPPLLLAVYFGFMKSLNKDLTGKKTDLVMIKMFYKNHYSLLKKYSDYSLIPDEVANMKKYPDDDFLDEEVTEEHLDADNVEDEDNSPSQEEEVTYSLPETAVGLDYDELMEDEDVAQYLEPVTPTVAELIAMNERIRRI